MNLQMAVSHANGDRELGMFSDAIKVLSKQPEANLNHKAVKAQFVAIYTDTKNWKKLRIYSHQLRVEFPTEVSWWIQEAYALRRESTKGLAAAEALLLEAHSNLKGEAIVPYNLACYRCVQGDFNAAYKYIKKALTLDIEYLKIALKDSDLQAIWSLVEGHKGKNQ